MPSQFLFCSAVLLFGWGCCSIAARQAAHNLHAGALRIMVCILLPLAVAYCQQQHFCHRSRLCLQGFFLGFFPLQQGRQHTHSHLPSAIWPLTAWFMHAMTLHICPDWFTAVLSLVADFKHAICIAIVYSIFLLFATLVLQACRSSVWCKNVCPIVDISFHLLHSLCMGWLYHLQPLSTLQSCKGQVVPSAGPVHSTAPVVPTAVSYVACSKPMGTRGFNK